MLTVLVELNGGDVSVAQPPQLYGFRVGVGEPMSCPNFMVTVTTGVPGFSWLEPLLLQATMRMLMETRKKRALYLIIRLNRVFLLSCLDNIWLKTTFMCLILNKILSELSGSVYHGFIYLLHYFMPGYHKSTMKGYR